MITEDDFNAWRENPVTEAVFKILRRKAEEAKETWLAESWGRGNLAPEMLADLRARSETWQDLSDMQFEELEQALEQ